MIKNSKEEILFTVHHFLNLYGETVEDVKDSSIIMCVAEDVFYPFSNRRLGTEVKIGEKFVVNPTYTDRANPEFMMDMIACGKDGNINMIEVGSKEISNEVASASLVKASEEIEKINIMRIKYHNR